jgi:hypothetical protein
VVVVCGGGGGRSSVLVGRCTPDNNRLSFSSVVNAYYSTMALVRGLFRASLARFVCVL